MAQRIKKTILVITGTRAEYGLLKSIMEEIRKSRYLKMKLLATGIHTLKQYGYTLDEIKKDGFSIDCVVSIKESDDMLQGLAKEIIGIKNYCEKHRPDMILVLGDRDEPFAAAIVAGHLKIPVAHIHGGDLSGPVVDEYIRHAITKFSHLHFAVSRNSRKRILQLGEEKWRVFDVGAPGFDAMKKIQYKTKKEIARTLHLDLEKKWFLIIQHPTPLSKTPIKKQILPTLKAIKMFDVEKIIIYPNSDTGSETIIRSLLSHKNEKNYRIFKTLPRETYLHLMKYSNVLIGNSSSGIIESGFFNLPAVNIGDRQRGREHGTNVINAGYDEEKIKKAISSALSNGFRKKCKKNNFYGNGDAGKKIVKILEKIPFNQKLLDKKFIYAKHS